MTKPSRSFDRIAQLARHERTPRIAAVAGAVLAVAAGGVWLAAASFGDHHPAAIQAEAPVRGLVVAAAPVTPAAIASAEPEQAQPGFMDLKSAQALEKAASFTFASRSVDPGTIAPAAFMENLFSAPDETPMAEVQSRFSQTADASAHDPSR